MKRKWFTQILVLSLVILLALSACTNEGGAPEGYPGSGSAEGSYPDSQADPAQPTSVPAVLYPGAADGDEVPWIQAVGMVLNGEVASILQTHDLKVSLTLRDGRTLYTIEPAIDAIFQIIENCGDPCKDIAVATE